jgi:hypothetical protein
LICEIKKLLYREKLTIAGARQKLKSKFRSKTSGGYENNGIPENLSAVINEIKEELIKLKNSL